MFLPPKQVKELLEDEAKNFVIFVSLQVDSKVAIVDLHVVCDFLNVFPYDINDSLPEHEL